LQSLAGHGLGGILADDMGLGKTLQALAHVLAEKKQGRLDRPCLLVAPTSVVWTWRNEARRFAPDLETLVLHGTDRKAHFEEIPASDLVITTYALLPRDAARLRAQAWHLVICDEAQALKNPDAQAAHVLRQMTRRQLVCLSGTPVENHLEELWSLTQLAVPGLLGDRKTFRRVYRTPIEKHGDDTRRAALARRLRPFLLRRTKDQVAGELPPRTETIEHVQLTGAQRDLYETVRTAMDKRVRAEIAKHGLARSQIMVLDALLKLRQVCCDPRLLKMDAAQGITESAKLERLMSMLADLTAEGRQVLVFSQFSSMLDLIAQALDAAGHAYVSLTGQTRDRETPVRRFQAGEVPIFLISLKAGGTGLTLTAADTVIHYDPWWNPAAEAQAADRAHRIGQDKPVFVYRLIAEGTVEDRIVDMQARKRDLASLVQDADGMTGPALDAQDIDTLLAPVDAAAEP
jgi:SNF2 family DNA or RNA helicase